LGLGHVARSQLLMVVPLLLRLMAATIVWQLAPYEPLAVYAYGYLFASIVAMLIAIAALPQPRPRFRSLRLPTLLDLKGMSGFAALGLSGAAPTELDKTLAAKLLPLDATGIYAAGTRVIGAAVLPVAAMLLSALPRLFRESHAGIDITYRLRYWLLGVSISYGILLALFLWIAAPLLENVFGAGFTGLVETVRWLCLAVPGFSLRIASASILMAVGQAWWRVRIEIGGVLLLILSAFLLVPRVGTVAMPLALAFAECSMALFGTYLVLGAPGVQTQKRTPSQTCRE
jgi:O-antigen/teichoic acid export membrane protein